MATATYLSFSAAPSSCAGRQRRWQATRASASASATNRACEVVSPKRRLPLRKVPGDYGPPVVGALRDQLEEAEVC